MFDERMDNYKDYIPRKRPGGEREVWRDSEARDGFSGAVDAERVGEGRWRVTGPGNWTKRGLGGDYYDFGMERRI